MNAQLENENENLKNEIYKNYNQKMRSRMKITIIKKKNISKVTAKKISFFSYLL
jgi:hypothetical protein